WERKELNNILKINSGRDYKQLNSGSIPVYGTGGYMLSVNDKLSDTDAVGIGRKGTIDKPLYLKAPFWTVDTLFYCTSKENSDVKFIYLLFQIINWKRYDESTGVPSLSKNTISNIKTYVPKIKEQDYISKLFFSLDNTLQLHERKYEELTLIKKALLQKLFPKKDGFKPEVRYKNFNDAWEQRKLGEVIISEHKGKVKSIMKGGNTNYLETNYLNGGTAQKVDAIADVSKDDVLILWDGSKAGTIYHGFEGALGSTLKAYVPKYSGDFLYQILKKNQDKIYQSYRTPNIPHVIKNFTEKFNVSIPTIIEQQEIGDFFKQLDSLITLHRRKLEKLKQLKKFLLQNMFI
ncbi:restriction endonuclease subunit S, partial [Ligilactobacillus salivarius]